MFEYELGDELEDIVSGLVGIVMVRAEYATGCIHYGLQQQSLKDGKTHDWVWLDRSQLRLKESGKVTFNKNERVSGPMPEGPKK